MNVTRLPRVMADIPPDYVVYLSQDEAIRLAYGPLGSYDASEVGWTAFSLVTALVEAIAAPAYFAPTDEVLEDMPPQVLEGEFRP